MCEGCRGCLAARMAYDLTYMWFGLVPVMELRGCMVRREYGQWSTWLHRDSFMSGLLGPIALVQSLWTR